MPVCTKERREIGERERAVAGGDRINLYISDSQSLLRGPLVVREISSSGPPIPIQINILFFEEQQNILSGPRNRKVWEPLLYMLMLQKKSIKFLSLIFHMFVVCLLEGRSKCCANLI
jgi:hypothetical protein